MIAKLEWTQSYAQKNIEQLQNNNQQGIKNNRTTTLERTAAKTVYLISRYHIFALYLSFNLIL